MKTIRRDIVLLSFLATLAFTLSGCGQLNDYVTKEVTAAAEEEIQNSNEYKDYVKYQSDGLLGEDGLYQLPTSDEAIEDPGNQKSIKITIATNSFLKCDFYTDENAETPIKGSEAYLNPGDCLYAADVSVNNDISNLYEFSCFRIWAYDQDNRKSNEPYSEVQNKSGLVLKVPENYSGKGFSIEPIGSYTDRHITARAYFLKDNQEKDLPNGQWKVNDKPFDNGGIDISPVESYKIVYDYSAYKDDYYFVKSTPVHWYSKESDNTVFFREVSSNEQETIFSVEMHPFVTMTVTNKCINWASGIPIIGDHGKGIIQSISREGNDVTEDDYAGQSSFVINKLKVGEKLSIRVGKDFKITGIDVSAGTPVPLGSNAENGYEYTIIIPDTNKGISIEITERSSNPDGTYQGYNQANAEVEITKSNGTVLKIGEELPGDKEKVTLTITPHEGYYIDGFTDKKNYSFVKKKIEFSNLAKDIQTILGNHQAIKFISLNLVFSDEKGTYTYKLDGNKITDSPLQNVRLGQKLEVNFIANKGYKITHSWLGAKVISDVKNKAGKSDSISEDIKITDDMDGTTVDYETFGIIVEKVG